MSIPAQGAEGAETMTAGQAVEAAAIICDKQKEFCATTATSIGDQAGEDAWRLAESCLRETARQIRKLSLGRDRHQQNSRRIVAQFVHGQLRVALGEDKVLPFEDETGAWWDTADCILAALAGDPGAAALASPRADSDERTAGEVLSPEAVLAALDRFTLQVLSRDVEPREDDTWAVIDTKTADPMTNWPGELAGEYPTHAEARVGLMKAALAVAAGQDRVACRKLCPSCQGSRGGMIGESGGSPDWDNCWTCNGEGFVPAQPAGAVPDSLRALSEAASEDWDTNEATPYILGPPIDGDIDRFEVIARGPHGYAKNGDDFRKWQANRMFAVAAVKHVRTLLASHPAGQSASGAEDADLQRVKDAARDLRERHGGNGWDAKAAADNRDRSKGDKRAFWQAVHDHITARQSI